MRLGIRCVAIGISLSLVGCRERPTDQPTEQPTAQPAAKPQTERDKAIADLQACRAIDPNKCAKEEAAFEREDTRWQRETLSDMDAVDAKANCIRQELGERYDGATPKEILDARSACKHVGREP